MSEWYEAEDDNIDLDEQRKEVDILVCSNDSGNVYVIVTFDKIKELYEKIKSLKG